MTDDEDLFGLSEHAQIRALIVTVWAGLGGRGTKADVLREVGAALPASLREYLADRGLASAVSGFFRAQREDGLPQAPAVDGEGTHAQLELMTVDECRFVVARYMEAAAAARAQALRMQALCLETHGVLIDLDDPWAVAS